MGKPHKKWLLFHWSPESGCVHDRIVYSDAESVRAMVGVKGDNTAFDPADQHRCWSDESGDKN